MSLNPMKQIDDVIDLTRQYHNLLQRNEDDNITALTWDGNVLNGTSINGVFNYLQYGLGSTTRVMDRQGRTQEVKSYTEFGQEINQIQKSVQPFGYTGYQKDSVSKTYFAQNREYRAETGCFSNEDRTAGFIENPFSMNRYTYCFNMPLILVDLDGAWPKWVETAILMMPTAIEPV